LHARRAGGELQAQRQRLLVGRQRDLVEEALDREGVVTVADAAPRREPRASTTCSASLLGMPYIGIGVPFMTIWSVRGGVPPRAAAM